MTFQDERTNQLIVQNCTLHIDTKTLLKVAFHSGVGILTCPHMSVVCIIDTVVIELRFISKQNVMMQLANAIEPLTKFQPQQNRPVRDVALAARGMDTCPLHAVFSTLVCGEHEESCNSSCTRTWTALYDLNNAFFFIDAFINITCRLECERWEVYPYLAMSGKLE